MMEQLVNIFIPNAYADSAAAGPQGGGISFVMMFVYFLSVYLFCCLASAK